MVTRETFFRDLARLDVGIGIEPRGSQDLRAALRRFEEARLLPSVSDFAKPFTAYAVAYRRAKGVADAPSTVERTVKYGPLVWADVSIMSCLICEKPLSSSGLLRVTASEVLEHAVSVTHVALSERAHSRKVA